MKKFLIFLLILAVYCKTENFLEENGISLKEQASIDLCNFPDITEGFIDLLYLRIDYLWHYGEYSKIFPVFNLITKILPEDVNAYCLGGWFLISGIAPKYDGEKKDKIKKYAIEFMEKGLKENPYDYRLYWELAWFYYNEDQYEKSLKYLQEAEKYKHPFFVENLKAHIYMKIGEKEKAIKMWNKIKQMYPERKDLAEKFINILKEEK